MRRVRFYAIEVLLVTVLALAVIYFGYLAYGLLLPNQISPPFSGEQARQYVVQQIRFGERSTGSDGSAAETQWLTGTLQQMGWDVIVEPFRVTDTVTANNIVAIQGLGTANEPVVILATHYDTRLYADKDPDEAERIQATPGANAGASGPAVLLEIARTLDVSATGHTVCLLFLDAEDNGGLAGWDYAMGSAQFLQDVDQTEEIVRCSGPRAVVYLDMVGADQALAVESPNSLPLASAIQVVADELGYSTHFDSQARRTEADAVTRYAEQDTQAVAVAAWDYPYRHTMQDTLDRVSAEALGRVGQTLKVWLERGAPF